MVTSGSPSDPREALYQKLSALHTWNGSRWITLPAWARFYLELGTILATLPATGNKSILALAVPTRAYVSAFIAAGLILMHAATSSEHLQAEEHVRYLMSLPVGTPVLLRQERRRLQGIYRGYIHGFGKLYFSVQIERENRTTYPIPSTEAYRIETLDQEQVELPHRQKGRAIQKSAPLVSSLLGEAAARFSRETQLDCVLLGTRSVIEQEVGTQRFAIISSRKEYQEGVLQDILRLRLLLAKNAAYRSHTIPVTSRHISAFARSLAPHTVFFDSGLSFLKWHQAWKGYHSVIVLDRTGRNFDSAREKLNQHFVQYRLDNTRSLDIPPVPAGVELMLFEVGS
ncbi:MAG: hypothetical protein L0332_13075 [Chloroflexi bacterium]|nr:hypothetical protein [Nitrososphaera sp.]MCI0727638.1 hypothetical protein [Chloroflexota bacterium]